LKLLLENKIRKNAGQYRHRKYFLNRTPIAQEIKERTDRWDCFKLKIFCTLKETMIRIKSHSTEWEKIFASYSTEKGLISGTYKEFKKLNSSWVLVTHACNPSYLGG
jgi:hypothetical protein